MRRYLQLLGGLSLGLAAAGAVCFIWIERHLEDRERHEIMQLERQSMAGAEATRQAIQRILDQVTTLGLLGEVVRQQRIHGRIELVTPLERQIEEMTARPGQPVRQLALIDVSGTLLWSSQPGHEAVDLSDREHFRVHAEGRREPFISEPLVGRVSGRWSIQATRRLEWADGTFDGVVVVSLDSTAISETLDTLRASRSGVSALLRDDGAFLARSAPSPLPYGTRIRRDNLETMLAQPSGTRRVVSTLLAQDVILSWEAVPGWPLIATFGVPTEPALSAISARRRELRIGLCALLLGGCVLLFSTWAMMARRRARRALATAEAEHRGVQAMINALPGAAYVATLAPDGSLSRLRPTAALAAMLGRAAGSGDWRSYTDAEGLKACADAGLDARRRGAGVAEYRLVLEGGRSIWVRDHLRCPCVLRGEPCEVVGLLLDVTEQRAAAAKAMTSAKLAVLGEMATGVAHEINQPAATIALAADVAHLQLSRGKMDLPRTLDALRSISAQTGRIREIIRRVQLFGRGDDPQAPLTPVSLAEALDGALVLVRGALADASIRLEVDLPPALPPLRARLVAMEQVLANILLNSRDALDAAAPSDRRIQISARSAAATGFVEVVVRDTGPGFPTTLLERVFEPFVTTKPIGRGTGLGLAIVYGIISGFGGNTRACNGDDGWGAVVRFSLPIWTGGNHGNS